MSTIRGTIRDGKVVLDEPANWPDGTTVQVSSVGPPTPSQLPDDEDDSPEAVRARLALMDRVQPFLTPEEEAEWHKALAEQKAWEIANWEAYCKKLEGLFE